MSMSSQDSQASRLRTGDTGVVRALDRKRDELDMIAVAGEVLQLGERRFELTQVLDRRDSEQVRVAISPIELDLGAGSLRVFFRSRSFRCWRSALNGGGAQLRSFRPELKLMV